MKTWLLAAFSFFSPFCRAQFAAPASTDSLPASRPHRWVAPAVAGTLYAGAGYLVYTTLDGHIQHESQEGKNGFKTGLAQTMKPMGRLGTQGIACGVVTGLAYLTRNERLQKTAMLWAGSLVVNEVVTNKLKNQFQRYRPISGAAPDTYDGATGPRQNRSLPSAHTSTAFATATVFATLYKDKGWVAPLAYTAATLVGLSRIYDNAHWASDVMAGAAVGFLSAKAVIGGERLLARHHIRIYPQLSRHSAGAAVVWNP